MQVELQGRQVVPLRYVPLRQLEQLKGLFESQDLHPGGQGTHNAVFWLKAKPVLHPVQI
jgi:hypothetical protein